MLGSGGGIVQNFSHKWISKLQVGSPNNLLKILRD